MKLIRIIIMKGRQAGYFIILACQRPDAKYLGDGVRDQFGFRVALGSMSASGYTMMFGSIDKQFKEKRYCGARLCKHRKRCCNRVLRSICRSAI